MGIAEAGNRFAPIVPIEKRAALFARHRFAITHQPGAFPASHNLVVQLFDCVQGGPDSQENLARILRAARCVKRSGGIVYAPAAARQRLNFLLGYATHKRRERFASKRNAMNIVREKIVVLESDATSREALHAALQGAGYDVVSFATRRDGLEAARQPGIDLLVLDVGIHLPDTREILAEMRGSAATEGVRLERVARTHALPIAHAASGKRTPRKNAHRRRGPANRAYGFRSARRHRKDDERRRIAGPPPEGRRDRRVDRSCPDGRNLFPLRTQRAKTDAEGQFDHRKARRWDRSRARPAHQDTKGARGAGTRHSRSGRKSRVTGAGQRSERKNGECEFGPGVRSSV